MRDECLADEIRFELGVETSPSYDALIREGGLRSISREKKNIKSVEDQLIRMDTAWTFAELKGDKKAAGEMIADDYVGSTQRGEIENRTLYLAGVVPNADMVKSRDYKLTIHGNMAIMTDRGTVQGVRNIQFRSPQHLAQTQRRMADRRPPRQPDPTTG